MDKIDSDNICETTKDVLDNILVLRALRYVYNKNSYEEDSVANKGILTTEEDKKFSLFVNDLFSSDNIELYKEFESKLMKIYSKFSRKYPTLITQKHVFAALTTFDYLRHISIVKDGGLKDINEKIYSIMNFDSFELEYSIQNHRISLLKEGSPIVDIDGNQFTEIYDFGYSFKYNEDFLFDDYSIFLMERCTEETDEDKAILIDTYGFKIKTLGGGFMIPENLKEVYYLCDNETMFNDKSVTGVTNKDGEPYYTSDNELVTYIDCIGSINGEEYIVIIMDGKKRTTVFSISGERLFVNGDNDREIINLEGYNDGNIGGKKLYKAMDIHNRISIINDGFEEVSIDDIMLENSQKSLKHTKKDSKRNVVNFKVKNKQQNNLN